MDDADFKDMPKKYAHTYFQYRPINSKKDWSTCYADEVRIWYAEAADQVDYFMVHTHKGWLRSYECEFKFDFPPIGVLNYKNTVVIANKYPARQWKKAATHENFVVYLPTKDLLEYLPYNYTFPNEIVVDFKWDVPSVHELFYNKFFSYKEALSALIKGDRYACAITDEFFVTNSHYNDTILLWRYNVIVAEIYKDSISYVEPMFEQEAIDFFKRNT